MDRDKLLSDVHLDPQALANGDLVVTSPIDGATLGRVRQDTPEEAGAKIGRAADAFAAWRQVPAPRRGELVRLLGEELDRKSTRLNSSH